MMSEDGFVDYVQGSYEKNFYDIITTDGKVYRNCWPNAGKFHAGNNYIPENRVAKAREIPVELWCENQRQIGKVN